MKEQPRKWMHIRRRNEDVDCDADVDAQGDVDRQHP